MANPAQSFRDFEQTGWEDAGVVAKYHSHLSSLTNQAIGALLDAVVIRKGSRVLDVATGAGYVAGAAAQCGADVIGIDFSVPQVRMARERYPGLPFEQVDAEALPFESATFDAVYKDFPKTARLLMEGRTA
jgi:ubiquinone/menaquinone biosynthesis C-methylase UbiE